MLKKISFFVILRSEATRDLLQILRSLRSLRMTKNTKNLIEIKNLHKQYETEGVVTKVLHGLNFDIKEGEFLAIMGPSGSGKSTLMHILSFLDRPTEGQYLFKGQETAKFDDIRLADLRN
ncbi:MAG: ATP-binding cassette domain-containing protein, partial [Patescibacteria group bacterium]